MERDISMKGRIEEAVSARSAIWWIGEYKDVRVFWYVHVD